MRSALADDALLVGARLADAAYTAWLVAQAESANALRAWFEARTGLRNDANLAYRAALDREEAAARDLERLSATLATYPATGWSGSPPMAASFALRPSS
jgi:hypothetical protein